MENVVRCPHCQGEFELSTIVRAQFESEIRAKLAIETEDRMRAVTASTDARLREMDAELAQAQSKVVDAAAREAELLRRQRELAAREQQACLEIERRVAEEAGQIRDQEKRAAEERYSREADEREAVQKADLHDARAKLSAALAREADVLKRQRDLEDREQQLTLDIERRLIEEAKHIREREAEAARERYSREADQRVHEKEAELLETQAKLAVAVSKEADLLKKQRELNDREQELALAVERRVAEEGLRIRAEETRRGEERAEIQREQQRLRDEEQRQRIDGLQGTISELQRRIQQGSQQAQGEAQEVVLRDLLVQTFVGDTIEDVPTGVNGADLIHNVRSPDGCVCGAIIWESKRTRSWSNAWLAKLRDEQREVGAACAVIVTQTMPSDVRHFGQRDGIWICAPSYATALAAALRSGLIEVALAKRSTEVSEEKMQVLYAYLTGPEFRNRVEGLVEAFAEMQEDLAGERRAMQTRWKRRERVIGRAIQSVTAFYGDLQGIAGRQLRDLPPLSLDSAYALPGSASTT